RAWDLRRGRGDRPLVMRWDTRRPSSQRGASGPGPPRLTWRPCHDWLLNISVLREPLEALVDVARQAESVREYPREARRRRPTVDVTGNDGIGQQAGHRFVGVTG